MHCELRTNSSQFSALDFLFINLRHETQNSKTVAFLLCPDSHAAHFPKLSTFRHTNPSDQTQKIASFGRHIFFESKQAQHSNGRSPEIRRGELEEGPAQQIESDPQPVTEI